MKQIIQKYLEGHKAAVAALEVIADDIAEAGELVISALQQGKKILIMGNGGSAADAQHMVAELVGRFESKRGGLPAVALTTDSSILTAVSNDFGYENVFARQVEALAQKGDVVIGISTSGTSVNVLQALRKAVAQDCVTLGFLGRDGGEIAGLVDLALTVAVERTAHIQEGHGILVHVLCQMVDEAFSEN